MNHYTMFSFVNNGDRANSFVLAMCNIILYSYLVLVVKSNSCFLVNRNRKAAVFCVL